jgi:hypothetical protein
MSELTSSEQFSPKGQINMFEQSHSPFSMNWDSNYGVTPEGKNNSSPKSFSFHAHHSQRYLMLRSGQEECSDFHASLEQAFPEENNLSNRPIKDIFTMKENQRRIMPVPIFQDTYAVTIPTYYSSTVSTKRRSGDIVTSRSKITR